MIAHLARLNLAVTAFVFFLYGALPIFDPAAAASTLGLAIEDSNGSVSVRAIYGGYLLGAGFVFALGAINTKYLKAGMLALLLIVSPILTARLFGLLVEQTIPVDQMLRVCMEAVSIVITVSLLAMSMRQT